MTVTTRFYPTFSGASFSPTNWRGAWDDTSDADPPCLLSLTKQGSPASTSAFESVATNNWDIGFEQQVSEPFTAAVNFTASDTLAWVLGVKENNAGMNAFWHVHAYVTVGNTNTVRGTLLTDSIGATEFTTTATGRGEGTKTLGSVSAQIGDRLVVEVGARCENTVTTSFNASLTLEGTNATDLTQGSTAVTTQPGWIELVTATDPYSTGTDYSLTAAQGLFALSGRTAALNTARSIVAGTGSYSLTGQAAGLSNGHSLTAAHGSFAMTGQAVGFFAARILLASQGSFGLTGNAAAFLVARKLGAGSGSFALTGEGAIFAYGRTLSATFGSFSLSGEDAELIWTTAGTAYVLACSQGSYLVTGESASFQRAMQFGVAFGSFQLLGQDAGLILEGPFAWVPVIIPETAWSAQAPGSDIWTPTIPATEAWTPETPGSDIWTPQQGSSTPWTPN